MKRYRLLATAFLDGAVREPGYIFTLPKGPDGEEILGPHRTVEHSADRLDFQDGARVNNRIHGNVRDVPLYEEVPDDAEIAPHVERSGALIGAEAVAGGTNVVSDERARAEKRANELEAKDDITEAECKELEGLHEYLGRTPHEPECDAPSSYEHPDDKNIGPESD